MMALRGSKSHPSPGLPAVNLLSASAFATLASRKLQRRFLVAAVVLVLLVAVTGFLQHRRVTEAERQVAVEQAETARLEADTKSMAPVRAFVAGVAQQELTVETNMAGEIYSSEVLVALQDAAPPGLRLESLTLTVPGPQTAAVDPLAPAPEVTLCPGPDPFNTRTVVGCVALSGTAGSRAEVGELVMSLGEMDLFVEPFISTTTTGDAADVLFTGSVGLSKEAFTHRFDVAEKTVVKGVAR